jgi:hypothetical protein
MVFFLERRAGETLGMKRTDLIMKLFLSVWFIVEPFMSLGKVPSSIMFTRVAIVRVTPFTALEAEFDGTGVFF